MAKLQNDFVLSCKGFNYRFDFVPLTGTKESPANREVNCGFQKRLSVRFIIATYPYNAENVEQLLPIEELTEDCASDKV